MFRSFAGLFVASTLLVGGCATTNKEKLPSIPTVDRVDLPRYMGLWYVIASIPTFVEKDAYNPVESYALNDDGTIAVKFTFHKKSFDGPLKVMEPKAFVEDPSNALWGVRLVWPIKSEYRIAYLTKDYSEVIVARNARDYLWIMARKPSVSDAEYKRLVDAAGKMGYDTGKIIKQPQQWP